MRQAAGLVLIRDCHTGDVNELRAPVELAMSVIEYNTPSLYAIAVITLAATLPRHVSIREEEDY